MTQVSPYAFRPIKSDDMGRPELSQFNCGAQYWDKQVANFVLSGEVLVNHKPPKQLSLLFCDEFGSGEILGFCNVSRKSIQPDRSPTGELMKGLHIVWLGLDTKHQGHGLGRLMLDSIIKQAEQDSLEFVDLYVHSENARAQQLYASDGFTQVDGPDHVEDQHHYIRMIRFL